MNGKGLVLLTRLLLSAFPDGDGKNTEGRCKYLRKDSVRVRRKGLRAADADYDSLEDFTEGIEKVSQRAVSFCDILCTQVLESEELVSKEEYTPVRGCQRQ